MSENANKPLSDNSTWQAIGAYAEAKEEIARMTAEKEALVQQGIRDHGDWRSKLNFLETDYKAEVARLTAENERLRKAGDAVIIAYQRLIVEHPDLLRAINVAIGDWNAAKKGGAK